MDDLTLIRRYVSKNFDIFIDTKFRIRDKFSGTTLKLDTLINEAEQIFDCECVNVCTDWYNARMRQETKDIYEYLDRYRVDLGDVNWVTLDRNNNEFSIRSMVKVFEGKYEEKFIRALYNDWYIQKIYKNTEDRLKFKLMD